ncbi:MAG: PKD domain-containing protein [Desulfococcaceae bacterium]
MKKLLGYLVILFLAATVPVLPLGAADPVYFEGEGYVFPTEKSRAGLETGFRLRQGEPAESAVRISVVSADFPDIEVLATVLDANGLPVTGLTEADFSVLEQSELEGVPAEQGLTCFEEVVSGGNGVSFAMTFDVSQSMNFNNRLPDAKVAATDFLAATDPADRGSLVSFSGCDEGGVVVPLTTVGTDGDGDGTPDLAAGINGLAPIRLTALFDGIGDALDTLEGASSPKGVIVFTDGQSNADCRYSMDAVIQKAQAAGTPVYTIGLALDPGSPAEDQLIQIAQETGGTYAAAPTAADMTQIYQDVADTIRSQYRLCYTSHNPAFDGTERFVTVTADGISGEGSYDVGTTAENRPPEVIHAPATTAMEGQSIAISATAADPDAGDSVVSMTLFYRTQGGDPDGPYEDEPMTPGEGADWTGQIPGTAVTVEGVEYYLRAQDTQMAQGFSGSALNPFSVNVAAAVPVADAGPDQSVAEGETVSLSGGASATPLPDGFLSYSWMQVAGEPAVALTGADTASPTFVAPDVGPVGQVFVFSLSVTDSLGRTDSDTVSVTVNDTQAPVPGFTFSPAAPVAGEPVRFTDESTPGDAAITEWLWNFGDLGTRAEPNPAFTFPDPGTYTVSLAVTDANGAIGSSSRSIVVAEPPCVEADCGGGGGCFLRSISEDSSGMSAIRIFRRWMER